MARPLRMEYPGAFYHVMNRGNAGEEVFPGDGEKDRFLDSLRRAAERFSFRVHAYCLMTNHYHLLLETPQANLSRAIQWLNVSYAIWYNCRNRRSGHLFQGRFKALLIEADSYLTALSRYIHLNPVRAGMVAAPEAYPWSSCLDFLGRRQAPGWLEIDRILSEFHSRRDLAIRRYREYLAINPIKENWNAEAAAGFILGSADFVDGVKGGCLRERAPAREIPQLRQLRRRSLEEVMKAVIREFGGTEEHLRRKGSRSCSGRLVAIGLARELCGLSGCDLGLYFGGLTGAAVTLVGKKFEREVAKDQDLRKKVTRVRELLRFKM